MARSSCSLWIMVARTDIPFMMHTLPHLVKMSNFPFEEKVLAIDTAPLSGEKINRPGIGTMEQLRDYTKQLIEAGVVDRVVDINYEIAYRQRVMQNTLAVRFASRTTIKVILSSARFSKLRNAKVIICCIMTAICSCTRRRIITGLKKA